MLKKQYLFCMYIIFIFLNITNTLAYVKRQESSNNNVNDVSAGTTIDNNNNGEVGNIDSDPAISSNNTSSDITTDPSSISNDNNVISNDNNDVNNDNNVNNENKINTVKSSIDSVYGSVQIEYVPFEKEDNFTFKLILYFSIIASMLVLICLVHLAVWMRPKFNEKRMKKRKSRTIASSDLNTFNMSSRNNSLNNFGMEELKDAKLKNESPEASMDFTSSYNASSTECIINLDKNSSNKNYRRKSNGSSKSYRKKD